MSSLEQEFLKALEAVKIKYGAAEDWHVEIIEGGRVFTDGTSRRSERVVVVHLNVSADGDQMWSDMLHESVHVLNPPTDYDFVTRLEEAAATYIALHGEIHGNGGWTCYQMDCLAKEEKDFDKKAYGEALKDLMSLTPDVFGLVRKLRGDGRRSLSKVEPDNILEFVDDIDGASGRLCLPMPRKKPLAVK